MISGSGARATLSVEPGLALVVLALAAGMALAVTVAVALAVSVLGRDAVTPPAAPLEHWRVCGRAVRATDGIWRPKRGTPRTLQRERLL